MLSSEDVFATAKYCQNLRKHHKPLIVLLETNHQWGCVRTIENLMMREVLAPEFSTSHSVGNEQHSNIINVHKDPPLSQTFRINFC